MIENKRAELQPSDIQDVSDEEEEFKKPQIYINELFCLEKEKDFIDDEAISHHVFALIFGVSVITKLWCLFLIISFFSKGYETSAFAISSTILLLAQHQDIQEKVFNELKQVFYSADELPDFDLISKLVYLEMVIKETIRLYPSAPYLLRLTTDDVTIGIWEIMDSKSFIFIYPFTTIVYRRQGFDHTTGCLHWHSNLQHSPRSRTLGIQSRWFQSW